MEQDRLKTGTLDFSNYIATRRVPPIYVTGEMGRQGLDLALVLPCLTVFWREEEDRTRFHYTGRFGGDIDRNEAPYLYLAFPGQREIVPFIVAWTPRGTVVYRHGKTSFFGKEEDETEEVREGLRQELQRAAERATVSEELDGCETRDERWRRWQEEARVEVPCITPDLQRFLPENGTISSSAWGSTLFPTLKKEEKEALLAPYPSVDPKIEEEELLTALGIPGKVDRTSVKFEGAAKARLFELLREGRVQRLIRKT